MKTVEEDMKSHSGYDTPSSLPHMRDSITTRTAATGKGNDDVVVIRTGPGKAHFIKALAQEFGTMKQVASPFIRPALDYNKAVVLRLLATEIRDRLIYTR